MRSFTKCLVLAAIAHATVALEAHASPGPVYSRGDLARIVDPKPRLAGWSFERSDPYIYPIPAHDPAFTLREWLLANSPDKKQRALAAALAKAGFVVGRHLVWDGRHGRNSAKVVVFAHLFRTAAGAQRGAKLLRIGGATRLGGLGSDAWAATDGRTGAALTWRRGSVLFYLAIDCDNSDCGFPPMPPGRTYAAQIDGRAKRSA
ncbi:MAG: hypothetical protein C5B48_03405 [Candidatus Rokuibacteriota bacterium]|nr:MAG: hypothetical protein C5B48_03405 [Candidatus Rokubacteria bacterium]